MVQAASACCQPASVRRAFCGRWSVRGFGAVIGLSTSTASWSLLESQESLKIAYRARSTKHQQHHPHASPFTRPILGREGGAEPSRRCSLATRPAGLLHGAQAGGALLRLPPSDTARKTLGRASRASAFVGTFCGLLARLVARGLPRRHTGLNPRSKPAARSHRQAGSVFLRGFWPARLPSQAPRRQPPRDFPGLFAPLFRRAVKPFFFE